MSAALLERLILDSWPAKTRGVFGGWTLLADEGVTGRVNAVAPLAFDNCIDIDDAIAGASAWQGARGNRPCFKIADGACAPPRLPEVLTEKGWRPHTPTLVMTAKIDDALASLKHNGAVIPDAPQARSGTQGFKRDSWIPGSASGRPRMTENMVSCVLLTPDLLPAIDAIIRETSSSDAEYHERRGIAARTPQPRRFAILERDGAAAAVGLSVITEGWAAIFLMRTHPAHRRQGLARDILAALLTWARDEGAANAYLQVEAVNAPAIALYRAAAFETAYSYSYWRPETKP